MAWYIIKGLGPGFDGMLLEKASELSGFKFITASRLVNRNIMIGDRELSYSLPYGAVAISSDFLEPIDNPQLREYDSKNPWGKFVCEGRLTKNNIEVSWAEYEYCTQVTVQEKSVGCPTKTLYTDNFNLDDIEHETIIGTINDSIRDEESLDDLIFALKELKNRG
jgi:hypothetical protein